MEDLLTVARQVVRRILYLRSGTVVTDAGSGGARRPVTASTSVRSFRSAWMWSSGKTLAQVR